ncbi:MAG TPA: aminotransferase class III-fold pyridoxal phosphate-dependent enzyme [Gemmatimonadales bacterium]|jgi:adenosylmethionine-8-amino-7-oxononanoate aminotransferase|nr:aminotransferase class III-fold pyridoxal phosphate-dependent enzyme [Gemmatimonadales bacterium]
MAEHQYPLGHVFYRKLNRRLPLITHGEGCWLVDETGKRYLDGCGGAFVANLGHGLAEIGDAMARQAAKIAYVNGTAFTHQPVEELATEVAALCPGDLNRVYPLSSGSEAVEGALKFARQYWVEAGKPTKHRIVALAPAYHGNTLLALSASAREHYKTYFREWLVDVTRVPAPYTYRCACHGRPPLCPACDGSAVEQAILALGPENVAAFIAEPVGGSSSGATVPHADYFRRIREICTRHDVLFVADEVLTGAGRTGTWAAIEPFGVVPDLMTLGKGLGGGYAPLSALVAPDRLVDRLAKGSGGLLHAQTYSHHPVLAAGALAAVRYLRAHNLIERCARMGVVLQRELQALRGLPHVGDIRGRGLLAAVEFVADVETRAPFRRAAGFVERVTTAAMDEGLVLWPNVGQADGTNGDLVMIAPPFVIDEKEVGELVRRLGRALERAAAATKTVEAV